MLDASEKRYPFIHPNWVFNRIFGIDVPTLVEDDRRLFYVAATRAIEQLILLSESRESLTPYLASLTRQCVEVEWTHLRAPDAKVNPVIVQVRDIERGSTYACSDMLKANGFKWSAVAKCWHKAYVQEMFSVTVLQAQNWALPDLEDQDILMKVDITVEPHGKLAEFEVRNGRWIEQNNNLDILAKDETVGND